MKISIVTISFNQAPYLRACIDSILTQTDCDVEYIVVDPGSTDGSRDLIESYGSKIVKVFSADEGPADGLNKGFECATGDVYGFVNSDDYLLPGSLKIVTEFFMQHPSNVFMTGQGFKEDGFGNRVLVRPSVLTLDTMLHRAAIIFQQSTFFSAAMFHQANGFNVDNNSCWDYELFMTFLNNKAQHFVLEQELAVFRLYADSISGSGRLEARCFEELDRLFIRHLGRRRVWRDILFTYYLRFKREIYGRILNGR